MSTRAFVAPKVSWTATFAYGGKFVSVEVPIWRRFVVFSQTKAVSPASAEVPLQKVTCPVAAEPVRFEEFETRHVPESAKQPEVSEMPFAKVEVPPETVRFLVTLK